MWRKILHDLNPWQHENFKSNQIIWRWLSPRLDRNHKKYIGQNKQSAWIDWLFSKVLAGNVISFLESPELQVSQTSAPLLPSADFKLNFTSLIQCRLCTLQRLEMDEKTSSPHCITREDYRRSYNSLVCSSSIVEGIGIIGNIEELPDSQE